MWLAITPPWDDISLEALWDETVDCMFMDCPLRAEGYSGIDFKPHPANRELVCSICYEEKGLDVLAQTLSGSASLDIAPSAKTPKPKIQKKKKEAEA